MFVLIFLSADLKIAQIIINKCVGGFTAPFSCNGLTYNPNSNIVSSIRQPFKPVYVLSQIKHKLEYK